ncbi:MAG: haloacid dehalogenase-like hydrolase [Candidatus Paceibacterota bacterium]
MADWDGTFRQGYTLIAWLEFLERGHIVYATGSIDFKFHLQRYREGELSYQGLLDESYRIYAKALSGYSAIEMKELARAFVREDLSSLFDETLDVFNTLHESDIAVFVVSGGPQLPLEAYQEIIPITGLYALDLRVDDDGRYTGEIATVFGGDREKSALMEEIGREYDIVFGFGDTPADYALLRVAKYPFFRGGDGWASKLTPDLQGRVQPLQGLSRSSVQSLLHGSASIGPKPC